MGRLHGFHYSSLSESFDDGLLLFFKILIHFDFVEDSVVNDEDEEEIDFETLDMENSNENDESEINEKDEDTVTLEDPIINETKEVPVVIIDWFMILKLIKKSKNCYSQI